MCKESSVDVNDPAASSSNNSYNVQQQPVRSVATSTPTTRAPHHPNTKHEQQEQHQQQKQQLGKLVLCSTGICVCYLYYGYLQERLLSTSSNNHHPDNSSDPSSKLQLGPTFVLLTQCVTNVGVAALWQRLQTRWNSQQQQLQQQQRLPHGRLLLTAGCYVVAMVCSNEAIRYVSYPVQVLAKSCKLLPTMLVGLVVEYATTRAAAAVGRKRHTNDQHHHHPTYGTRDWLAALAISMGMVLFHSGSPNQQQQQQQHSHRDPNDSDEKYYGTLLLVTSLIMDGILSSLQNILKCAPRPRNAVETMFYVNLYAATLYLYPLCLLTGQWRDGVAALTASTATSTTTNSSDNEDPVILWNFTATQQRLLILNAAAGLGQVFIFLTIVWFSPVTTTIITTTRKFLTILLSVFVYQHALAPTQWMAVMLVFAGLYLAMTTHATTTTPNATTIAATAVGTDDKVKQQ